MDNIYEYSSLIFVHLPSIKSENFTPHIRTRYLFSSSDPPSTISTFINSTPLRTKHRPRFTVGLCTFSAVSQNARERRALNFMMTLNNFRKWINVLETFRRLVSTFLFCFPQLWHDSWSAAATDAVCRKQMYFLCATITKVYIRIRAYTYSTKETRRERLFPTCMEIRDRLSPHVVYQTKGLAAVIYRRLVEFIRWVR